MAFLPSSNTDNSSVKDRQAAGTQPDNTQPTGGGTSVTVSLASLGFDSGSFALGSGVNTQAISFNFTFPSAPKKVLGWITTTSGGIEAMILVEPDRSTITTTGVTFLLGSATPDANQILTWLAVL